MDNTTRQARETAATALWPETVLMVEIGHAARATALAWRASPWKDAIRKLDPPLAAALDNQVNRFQALWDREEDTIDN